MRKLLIAAVCVAALPLLLISEGGADNPSSDLKLSGIAYASSETPDAVVSSESPASVASAEEADISSELLALNGPIEKSTVQLKSEAGIEGGLRSLAAKMSYPKALYEAGAEANIFLEIVVDKDGSVEKINFDKANSRILKGENNAETLQIFANEAMTVVRALEFYPAVATDGSPVKSQLTLPIVFKLPETGKVAPSRREGRGSSKMDYMKK